MASTPKQLAAQKRWVARNLKRVRSDNRARYARNRTRYQAIARKSYRDNRAARLANNKTWRERNKKPRRSYLRRWAKNNRAKINARRAERYENDPAFKVLACLRANLACKLKRARAGKGSTKTIELLGCSLQSFMLYIESKFKGKMSWKNHGTFWHLDHIKATSRFDLRDMEQRRQAFHFSNYQPLRAVLNLRKGNKLIEFPESEIAHPVRLRNAIRRAQSQFQP